MIIKTFPAFHKWFQTGMKMLGGGQIYYPPPSVTDINVEKITEMWQLLSNESLEDSRKNCEGREKQWDWFWTKPLTRRQLVT